jgi:hypothetical protein
MAIVTLLINAMPALAIPTLVPIAGTNAADRQILITFEVSPWDAAQGQAPIELDGAWTSTYVANLVWSTGMVTVSAADFNDVVTQSGGGVFANVNMSAYSFQIDTSTGAVLNGSFTGSAEHNGAAVGWSGSFDSSTAGGYDTMSHTATAVDGSFGYWRGCTMGMNCSILGGVTGSIDWTFNTAMGIATVTAANPFGNIAIGEVPEPSTALLLSLGLLGLGVAGRNRDV